MPYTESIAVYSCCGDCDNRLLVGGVDTTTDDDYETVWCRYCCGPATEWDAQIVLNTDYLTTDQSDWAWTRPTTEGTEA
jgi:hypothetical protein